MGIQFRVFWLALLAAAGGGYLAAQITNTYVYNEITTLASPGADYYNYPLISRSANRIIFTKTASGTTTLWAINPDGTGLTQLDTESTTPDNYHFLSITDDGSKALIWSTNKILVVDTNGTGALTLVTVDGNFGISQARITGDGSKVIFTNDADDNLTTTGSTPLAAGLYEINPDGTGLHAIVTETTLATFLGQPEGNIRGFGALGAMDVSLNGSHIVFNTNFAFSGEYLIGVNGDGTGLHTIIGPITAVFTTGISEDGTKVWYNGVFAGGTPSEIGVIGFGGGTRTPLITTGQGNAGGGLATDLQLTTDGSKLLTGDDGIGRLINTDGSGITPLFVTTQGLNGPLIQATGYMAVTMDATATHFAFTEPARGVFPTIDEIGFLTINPSSTGVAPAITNPAATPPFIVINGGSSSTFSATVTAPRAVAGVTGNLLLPATGALVGLNNNGLGPGANNLYSGSFQGGYDGKTGARTVRIQAETTDANSQRHGTAVDFGPFNIDASAPASQTISFGALSGVSSNAAPFTILATASSGLTVSFVSTTPAVCTVSGTTVTIVAAGTCSITASQAGSAGFQPAASVTQSFTVTQAQVIPLQIPGGGGAAQVTLAGGTVSIPYSQPLPASNGVPPYSWSVLGGALPAGLSLSSSGTLSGTPGQAGGFEFTGKVTDKSGATASSIFVITIAPQTLSITTVSPLPNGIVGSDYPPQIISVTGGNAPYTLQITGALPGGLTLSAGEIIGIPTTAGTSSFTVTATDSSSPALTASAPFQLTAAAAGTELILSQGSIAFTLSTGATGLPPGASVSVRSSLATQSLNYSVSVMPAAAWLDVSGAGSNINESTPGAIRIGLDPSALSLGAGVSKTSVVVACIAPSPCAGNSQTISVSLTVAAAPPQLFVTTSLLSFTAQASNPQPVSLTMGLQNMGGGSITVNSVTAADSFVTIAGAPSTLAAGPSFPFMVTVNPAGLTAGFYQSTILVSTSAGSVNVPVTVLVAQNPTMTLNPAGMQFPQQTGSSPGNPNGSFLVTVSGNSTVYWTATLLPGPNWVALNTTSGSSTSANPGSVSFSIVPAVAAALMPRSYWAAIQVASSSVVDSPQTFIVVLDVAPATSPSVPVPTPAGLLFLSNGTSPPAPQTVHVYASSQTPLTYQASSDSPWLLLGSASGSTYTALPGTSSVSVNPSGLAAGVYRGNVSYALSSAAVRTVNVTLVVEAGASASADRAASANAQPKAVTCSSTQLVPTQTGLVNNFSQPTGFPTPLSVQLVDNCGNPIANGAVDATFSNGDPPLALVATDTTTGFYSGTWTPRSTAGQVTINARATAPGFAAVSVQILGQVTPNSAPLLTPNGTLNAFAIAAEPGVPIAPGTIVQIYGSNLGAQTTSASTIPLPTNLNQTSVIIGGLMAPLYFASPGQINAQVPFELAAGSPYQVIVDANGALSTPNSIQLTSDSPGIAEFAAGQIIAQHLSDNSLITETSPAMPGEFIVFYVAGMGLTNPGVASGTASPSTNLPALLDTPTLTLNGASVTNILFAGLTPTLVGLYQVDFQVPANAPNGDLPLVLTQTSGLNNSTILPVHN